MFGFTCSSLSEDESRLKEAQRTYAAGLLAIALTNTAHCEEAVRSGFIGCLVSYLHSSIARLDSSVELRSPSSRQQPVARLLQGNPHPVVRPLQASPQTARAVCCACAAGVHHILGLLTECGLPLSACKSRLECRLAETGRAQPALQSVCLQRAQSESSRRWSVRCR